MPDAIYDTSSIGRVIDSLVVLFKEKLGTRASVFDGFPVSGPLLFVAIGDRSEPVGDSEQEWAELGFRSMYEEYDLAGTIWAFVGGAMQDPNDPVTANTQKASRDLALGLWSTIANAMLNNVQLEKYGTPFTTAAGWITAVRITEMQTSYIDGEEAGKGRRTTIEFKVRIKNRLGAIG